MGINRSHGVYRSARTQANWMYFGPKVGLRKRWICRLFADKSSVTPKRGVGVQHAGQRHLRVADNRCCVYPGLARQLLERLASVSKGTRMRPLLTSRGLRVLKLLSSFRC